MALVAVVMVVAGLGFKITAVPFHFYAPDVYQGTSTGAAALLAFIPKLAGFVALIRVLGFLPYELSVMEDGVVKEIVRGPGPLLSSQVSTLLWIVAAVTMTLGNVLALLQDNVKRLLAYSSVAHAGYMLIGLAVFPYLTGRNASSGRLDTVGTDAVLFYLIAYGAMTIGAFAVLEHLSTRDRPVETIDDLAGLSQSHPGVALLMTTFLFSLIGLPPMAGFWGKLLVFVSAFSVSYTPGAEVGLGEQAKLFRILLLIAALNAAVGAWYYLRIIAVMYLRTPLQRLAKPPMSTRLVAVWACALITLLFGATPAIDWLKKSASQAIENKIEIPAGPKAMNNAPPK
jgi:NADH-quinone oxidoreductase subunit N